MSDRRNGNGRRLEDVIGGFLQVKNWREFQHYKHRNPPWIRLHRKMLDDKDFHKLPLASRALAPMLWLLASESVDGTIKWDVEDIAFRLRTSEKDVLDAISPLIERGFFAVLADDKQTASVLLAPCLPDATTETETETETEGEKPLVACATQRRHQLPEGFQPKDHHKNLAARLSVDLESEVEKFADFHRAKGNVMKDWDLALNTWLRNAAGRYRSNGNGQPRQSAFERVANELRETD